MPKFPIKRNDTSPAIKVQCTDSTGTAIDLSGASVSFHMTDDGDTIVNSSATIMDASNGKVKYEWSDGDTDSAGRYQAEFEVTYSDSSVETFPNNGFIVVEIHEDGA